MDLLNIAIFEKGPDIKERRERLMRIRKSIETRARFEGLTTKGPSDMNTLKRHYNLESIWICVGGRTRKFGSADYQGEVGVFEQLREKYSDLFMIKLHRGSSKYYVLERDGIRYAFSTPLELLTSDIYMLLKDIEKLSAENKAFLEGNNKLKA
jgi:hypothetical protein